MQIYVILIACAVLLLCLFFKVPVFISVFAGALVYFLLGASSSPAILAQRIISGTQSIPLLAIPFFYMRRRFYELYRCDKKDYEFL